VTARFASVRVVWHDSPCPTALLEQAHLIGAHHLRGEWWTVAQLLHTAQAEVRQTGSWNGFLAEVPISRMHAWRLLLLAETGLLDPHRSLRSCLAEARVLRDSP
jgi:hypothetical protein